jgi:hypothetical protein
MLVEIEIAAPQFIFYNNLKNNQLRIFFQKRNPSENQIKQFSLILGLKS